jgi:septal ring factor EnvC (AmiA/AmiB activator)
MGRKPAPPTNPLLGEVDALRSALAHMQLYVQNQNSIASVHAANNQLSAQLSTARTEIANLNRALRTAHTENARLRAELDRVPLQGAGADVGRICNRVRRAVAKELHPDSAKPGETAKQALHRVFVAMGQELDSIKGGK